MDLDWGAIRWNSSKVNWKGFLVAGCFEEAEGKSVERYNEDR